MDYALFIESMDYEFNKIHEDCDRQLSYIIARYEESVCGLDVYTEAEKSGGLLGMIKSFLETILRGIRSVSKTLKGFLFGTEIDKSKENEKANLDKDPNILLKFINGDLKDSKQLLEKARKGELNYSEVQGLIKNKNTKFKQIAGTALTMGAMFGICKVGEKYLNNWQREIEDAYRSMDKETMNAVEQIARTKGKKENEETIKRCTEEILAYMNTLLKDGENCFESMTRQMYMRKYIRKKLTEQADSYDTKKGYKNIKKKGKEEIKNAMAEQNAEEEKEYWRQKSDELNRKNSTKINEIRNKTAEMRNKNYNDSNESTYRNTSGSKDDNGNKKKNFFRRIFK